MFRWQLPLLFLLIAGGWTGTGVQVTPDNQVKIGDHLLPSWNPGNAAWVDSATQSLIAQPVTTGITVTTVVNSNPQMWYDLAEAARRAERSSWTISDGEHEIAGRQDIRAPLLSIALGATQARLQAGDNTMLLPLQDVNEVLRDFFSRLPTRDGDWLIGLAPCDGAVAASLWQISDQLRAVSGKIVLQQCVIAPAPLPAPPPLLPRSPGTATKTEFRDDGALLLTRQVDYSTITDTFFSTQIAEYVDRCIEGTQRCELWMIDTGGHQHFLMRRLPPEDLTRRWILGRPVRSEVVKNSTIEDIPKIIGEPLPFTVQPVIEPWETGFSPGGTDPRPPNAVDVRLQSDLRLWVGAQEVPLSRDSVAGKADPSLEAWSRLLLPLSRLFETPSLVVDTLPTVDFHSFYQLMNVAAQLGFKQFWVATGSTEDGIPQGILLHQPLPSTFPSRLPAPTLQVGLLDKNIVAFRRYPDLVPFQDVPALAKLLVAEHQRDPTQSLAITATRGWTSAGDSFLSYGTGTGVIHDNGQSLGTIIEILKAARQAGFSTIWLREGVMPHFFDFEQATATGLGAAGTPFWVAGLDDAVLESQIAAHQADVQTCLKGQKSLEIDVVAEVRPDGEVSHATLSESSPSTGSAGSCLVNLVAAWKFPATVDNFGTTLLIPFFTGGTP